MKRTVSSAISLALVVSMLAACSPPGPKVTQVKDEPMEITFDAWASGNNTKETITRDGTYTGQLIDGIANGEGSYTTTNSKGESWTYTGEFKDGLFDGYGETSWTSGQVERGNYVKGLFSPTQLQALDSSVSSFSPDCHISDATMTFIEENQALFPVSTEEALAKSAELVRFDLTYEQMEKSLKGLDGVLYHCPLAECFDITESSIYGYDMSDLYAMDKFGNIYVIFYPGTLPDVFSNTLISFTGLPIGSIQYDNVNGGVTNAIAMIGSSVSVASN